MNYIIVQPEADMTSADRAVAITEELFRVSRPDSVRNPADVSRYVFGWVDHPTSGERALTVDVDYTINVQKFQRQKERSFLKLSPLLAASDSGTSSHLQLRSAINSTWRTTAGSQLKRYECSKVQ